MEIEYIEQTISEITALPPLVDAEFYASANKLYGVEMPNMSKEFQSFIPKLNKTIDGINIALEKADETIINAVDAKKSAALALYASNYKGDWVDDFERKGYALGDSITYTDGFKYVSKINDNLEEPISKKNTLEWDFVEAVSPAELNEKADATFVEESVNELEKKIYEKSDKTHNHDIVYAKVGGDSSKLFKVKTAEEDHEAVNKKQMELAIEDTGFPIGYHFLQIRETPNDNELVEYGGEFLRIDFPKLWEFIQTQTSLLLTDEDWQIENTTNGVCGFFSSGDGSTTFRLRNLNEAMFIAVDGVINTVGAFRVGDVKSHNHIYYKFRSWSNYKSGEQAGGYQTAATATNLTGGEKNTVDRVGALPLIISK